MKNRLNKGKQYFESLSQEDKIIILIAFLGVIIRLIYIGYTNYDVRQHDTSDMVNKEGHLAYIIYWYNNFKLPDFDPRRYWQFYQPPLHHIIGALWLRLNVLIGFDFKTAVENIQILTLIYSSLTVMVSYKIFKELGIQGKGIVISFALVCLHPTLIMMSGSINNDMLCIMLQLIAILATIKWYKTPSFKNIIIIALFLGLSMMTKASGVLLAPGIGFIFISKFIKSIEFWKKANTTNTNAKTNADKNQESNQVLVFINQFFIFLLIAIPIGMWWSIYANFRFGMPIGYVPKLPVELNQFIGGYTAWERFLDFDLIQFRSVFENWGDPVFEHNILIAILKTSLFGEYNLGKDMSAIVQPATILFWTNTILTLISLVAMIYVCLNKIEKVNLEIKIFFGLIYIVVVGAFVKFCFQFPHTCTMDFRYIVPTMIIGAAAIGLFENELVKQKDSRSDVIIFFIKATTVFFCVFGIVTYIVLGLA